VRLEGGNHRIPSPGVWQTQFPSLRNAQGLGRYRRQVDIPENWAEKRIVLLMEGVFHESELLVDGVRVASHRDGWTPIEVDLTDALAGKPGFELGVDANTPDDRESGRFSQSLVARIGMARRVGSGSPLGLKRATRSTSPERRSRRRTTSQPER
jgi:hypothetical protein